MPTGADAITVAFVAWRLAYFFTSEVGPWEAASKTRLLLKADDPSSGFLGKLFACVFCLSFWTALALAAAWWAVPESHDVIRFLAIWAGASAIQHLGGGPP